MSSKTNSKLQIGKGIEALLGSIKNDVQNFSPQKNENENIINSISRILLADISINPKQPRKDFNEEALQELADSIKLHDVIQPITVIKLDNKKYQLISGERRFRASKLAGLKDIPAYIRTANDQELLEMAILENIQREDLNAIEVAISFKRLMDECDLTQEQLSERLHKNRSTIANFTRLLKLPPSIQAAVRKGEISMGHAKSLISIEHIDKQLSAFHEIIEKGLSVRASEELCKKYNQKEKNNSFLNKKDSSLPPAYKKIEDQIASHLSTKTFLERTKKGAGKIVIEFYNDNDLERILDKMNL